MRLKRAAALALSVIIALQGVYMCLAEDETAANDSYILTEDDVVSPSAFDVTQDSNVSLANSTDVAYAVEGGNIYFDESTGTITDCDTSVTSAVIPSEINGVSVTSIGSNAFSDCSSLTSITIPEGVTSIDSSAFYNCSSLTTAGPIGSGCNYEFGWKTSIPANAFSDCSSLTSITIPEGVTSIGSFAFSDCSSLTSITIPEGVTSIGSFAFEYCISLTSITIPEGVTSIGSSAFWDCSSLTSITIPEGVTSIGSHAFYNCSSLTSITIPEGVTSIGSYAFYNCSSLTSITIPEGVTSIGYYAFRYCSNLTIYCPSGSYAETYAKNNNIPYTSMNDNVIGSDGSKLSLPSTKTYSVGTETGLADCLTATLTPHVNDWSDIVWTSSNTDVAEIVSPRLGISGVTSDCLFCDLNCKAVGTSVITVTNSKGASASCLVVVNDGNSTITTNSPTYGVSSKPATNTGKTVEEQLKSAIDEYETALYVYEQNLVKAMENKQVSEVSDDDIYQSMKTRIAGMVSVPAAAQEACYHAIYETIKDMSFSKTAFDKIDMSKDEITVSTSVIKQITNAFASEEREYDYGMYKIKVNVIGFNGANFGMLTYTQKNKVSTPVTVGFTTNATEMAQIMSDYLNQINQMEVNALNEALNATIDYFEQNVGIDKYIKSRFTKIIDKYAPKLNNLGLGEVVSFVSDCKSVCEQVDKISKTDMSDYASVYDEIKALKNLGTSETSKISTTITSKAYSNLRDCRVKLINAAINYIADTPEPSLWDKITSLKCPVDVIVYDENGTEIGSIIGDEITCNSSDIMLKKTGDIKEVYTANGIEVSFKIIATDYGLLNVTIEDYIDNTVVGRQNFYNIPLDIDDEFITSAISSKVENMIIYTADGDRIDDEYIVSSSEAGVNISIASSENGTVYNAGEYVKGDGVNLKAVPNDGYKFAGWYNEDTLLSTNLFYNFTATEDISLTAKFIEDNSDVDSILKGDITGDGILNRTDLLRLNKYFAGLDVEINTEAADVTGDGNINRSDLLRLNKYFAGQDVTLD